MISRCVIYATGSLLLLSTIVQVLPHHLKVPKEQILPRSSELVHKNELPERSVQNEMVTSIEYNLKDEKERPEILKPYQFSWENLFKANRELNPDTFHKELLRRVKQQHPEDEKERPEILTPYPFSCENLLKTNQEIKPDKFDKELLRRLKQQHEISNTNAPKEDRQLSGTRGSLEYLMGFSQEFLDDENKYALERRKRDLSQEIMMATLNTSSELDDSINYPLTLSIENENYSQSGGPDNNVDGINQSNNLAMADSSESSIGFDTSDEISDVRNMALVTPAPRKSLNKKYSEILGLNLADIHHYSANTGDSKCKSGSCKQRQNSRDLGHNSLFVYQDDNSEISSKAILDTNEGKSADQHFKSLRKTSDTRNNDDYVNIDSPYFRSGTSNEEFLHSREGMSRLSDEDYQFSSENWRDLEYSVPYYKLDEYPRLQKQQQRNAIDRINEGFRYKRVGDYSNSNIWDKYSYPKNMLYGTNSDLAYHVARMSDDSDEIATTNERLWNENIKKISKPTENPKITTSFNHQNEFPLEVTYAYLDSGLSETPNEEVEPIKKTFDSERVTNNEVPQEIQKTNLISTSEQIQNEEAKTSNEIKTQQNVLLPTVSFVQPNSIEGITSNINSGSLEKIEQKIDDSQSKILDEVYEYVPASDSYVENNNFGIEETNMPNQDLFQIINPISITTDSSIENLFSYNITESEKYVKNMNSENSYETEEKDFPLNIKHNTEETFQNGLNPNVETDKFGYSTVDTPKIPRYIVDELNIEETLNPAYDEESKWPSWFIPEKHLVKKISTYDVPLPLQKTHPYKIKHYQIHEPEPILINSHQNKYDSDNKGVIHPPIHDNWNKQPTAISTDKVVENDKSSVTIPTSKLEEPSLREYNEYLTLMKSLEQLPVKKTNPYKIDEIVADKHIYNIVVPDTPIWNYNQMPDAIHEKYITKEVNMEGNIIHNDYLHPNDKGNESKGYSEFKIKSAPEVAKIIPYKSTTIYDWLPLPPNDKVNFAVHFPDNTNTADMFSNHGTKKYFDEYKEVYSEENKKPVTFLKHKLTEVNSNKLRKDTIGSKGNEYLSDKQRVDIHKDVEHGDNCEEIVKLLLAEGKEELSDQDQLPYNVYTEHENHLLRKHRLSEAPENIELLSHGIKQAENKLPKELIYTDNNEEIIKLPPFNEKFHAEYLKKYNSGDRVDIIKLPSADKKFKNIIDTNEHLIFKNKSPVDKEQLLKIITSPESENIALKKFLPHENINGPSVLTYKNMNKKESYNKYLPIKSDKLLDNEEHLKILSPIEIEDINLENKYLFENDSAENKNDLVKLLSVKKITDGRKYPDNVISNKVKEILPPNHENELFKTEFLFNNIPHTEERGEIYKIYSKLSEKPESNIEEQLISVNPLKIHHLTNIYDVKPITNKQSGVKYSEIKNILKNTHYLHEEDKVLKLTPSLEHPNKATLHNSEEKMSWNVEKNDRYVNKYSPYISDLSKDITEGYSVIQKPGKLMENKIDVHLKTNHLTQTGKQENLQTSREEAEKYMETKYLPAPYSEEYSHILKGLSNKLPHKVIGHIKKYIYENKDNVKKIEHTHTSEEKNHKVEYLKNIPTQKENYDTTKSFIKIEKDINHPGATNSIIHKNHNIKNELNQHKYPLHIEHVETINMLKPEKYYEDKFDTVEKNNYFYSPKPTEIEVESIEIDVIKPEYFPKLKDKIKRILVKYNLTSTKDEHLKPREDIPQLEKNYKFSYFVPPGNSKFNNNTSSLEHAHKEYKLMHKLSHHKPLLDELKMHIDSLQELKVVDELVNSNLYKDAAQVQIEEAMHSVDTGSKENSKNDIYAMTSEVENIENKESEDSHIAETDILALIKSLKSGGHRRESDIKFEDAINVCRKLRKLIGKGISKENFKSLILKLLNNTEVLHNPNEALKIVKHYKILNSEDSEGKGEIEDPADKEEVYENLEFPFVKHKKVVIYEDDKSFPPNNILQSNIIKPKMNVEKFSLVKSSEYGNNDETEERYIKSGLLDKILTITNKTNQPNYYEDNANIEVNALGTTSGKNSNKIVYHGPETSQEITDTATVQMICEKFYGFYPSIYNLCGKHSKVAKTPEFIEETNYIATEQPSVDRKHYFAVTPMAELPDYIKVQKEYDPIQEKMSSHFKEFNEIPHNIENNYLPHNSILEKHYSSYLKELPVPPKPLNHKDIVNIDDDKKYTCFDILKVISGREKDLINYFKDDKDVLKALGLHGTIDISDSKKRPSCTEILKKLKSRGLCSDEEFENMSNELLQLDNLKEPKFDNFKNYLYHQYLNKSYKLVDMEDMNGVNSNYNIPNNNKRHEVPVHFEDYSKIKQLHHGKTTDKIEHTEIIPGKELVSYDLKIGEVSPLYRSKVIQEIHKEPVIKKFDYLAPMPSNENHELDDIILKHVLSVESAKMENKEYVDSINLISNEEIDRFLNKLLTTMKIKQHAIPNRIEEIASIVEKWCRLKLSHKFTKETYISQRIFEKLRERIFQLILKKVHENPIHYYNPEIQIKYDIPCHSSSSCHNSKWIRQFKIPPMPIAKHDHIILKHPLPVHPTLDNVYVKEIHEIQPMNKQLLYDKLLHAHPHDTLIGDQEYHIPHHANNIGVTHISSIRPNREIAEFVKLEGNHSPIIHNPTNVQFEGEISNTDTHERKKRSLSAQNYNNSNIRHDLLETQVKPPPVIP